MKKTTKIIAFLCCLFIAVSSSFGCKDNKVKGKTVVQLWTAWDSDIAGSMRKAIDSYNETNQDKIYVKYSNKPLNSYSSVVVNALDSAINGPDLILTSEENFRNWASRGGGYFEDLTSYVANDSDSKVNEIFKSAIGRYHYNAKKMTSKPTDPLLAIPYDIDATTMLYNETALLNQGIKVISVDEQDLDAFNNGAPDRYGKTKADYGITLKVRNRGFDRRKADGTNMNYLKGTYDQNGEFVPNVNAWPFPEYDNNGKVKEVMIFNNRISMSWDEVEDLGRIMSGLTTSTVTTAPNYYKNNENVRPSTDWGYYTEWWFSYGWGVGGDCVKDTTGEGDYEFSVLDTTKKRAVYNMVGSEKNMNVDTQAVDAVTGKPIFVEDGQSYNLKSNQYVGDILPTQRSAFERFFYLQKPKEYNGLYLGPRQKTDIGSSTDIAFFSTGRLAFFATTKSKMLALRKMDCNFTWDICQPISYRVYDENGDNVISQTACTQFNHTKAMGIWKNSPVKEAAYKVLKYYTTGQLQADVADVAIQCSAVPSQMEEYFIKKTEQLNVAPKNISIFSKVAPCEFLIDIYYFADSAWLWEWANPLNQNFRENDKGLDEFYNDRAGGSKKPLVDRVNEMLKDLKDKFAV